MKKQIPSIKSRLFKIGYISLALALLGFISVEIKHRSENNSVKENAKAEEARVVALAKAEEARVLPLEAKAKLSSEIGAGRVGAAVDLPLLGKNVMPFAFCPAGSFLMGSPEGEEGRSDDENQVQVTLSKGFWMAKTEVTQAQWQAVMGSNPSNFKGDDLPVENVSWDDVQEFIEKVNGSGVMPSGWKFAMPTEAQWEYACRAGEMGPYSGETIEQMAWYDDDENSDNETHDVSTKKANTWGLHDMHGNVWEWCADWHDVTLPGGMDPTGTSSGVYRVYRGGSWNNFAAGCRAASRRGYAPTARRHYLGFRPALVPSE